VCAGEKCSRTEDTGDVLAGDQAVCAADLRKRARHMLALQARYQSRHHRRRPRVRHHCCTCNRRVFCPQSLSDGPQRAEFGIGVASLDERDALPEEPRIVQPFAQQV
jgi:hypothetical protein